jgi:hypothetical protein
LWTSLARRTARRLAPRRACVAAGAWLATIGVCASSPIVHAGAPVDGVKVQLSADHNRIEVIGLPPEVIAKLREATLDQDRWRQILSASVAGEGQSTAPMLGEHRVDGDLIVFAPRFPLRPGLKYRVVFDPAALPGESLDGNAGRIESIIALPARRTAPATTVAAVYPSGGELPENLLKFYVHFSAPMRRGDIYRRVRIVDAQGEVVPAAFLEIGEELWDRDGRRLTLLFDPGRIKRGLKPREDAGTPLVAGHVYVFVIDATCRDARGMPLVKAFRKEFRVTAPDAVQPDPKSWRVTAPLADSRQPLVVKFDEPLDHAMLQRVLRVRGPSGAFVVGDVAVDQGETHWSFRPAAPWQAGLHALVVDTTLEDRAGNSIGRPFEVDEFQQVERAVWTEQIELPFEVAASQTP